MEKTMTYEAAAKELAGIAKEMEDQTISVDELAEKVKRASELIEFCQTKLKSTEAEVAKIISSMEGPKE